MKISSLSDPVLQGRIAERVAARLAERTHVDQRAEERTHADQRAEDLLGEVLSEVEHHQLTEQGYVEVPSALTPGRMYRIPRSGRLPVVYEQGVPIYRLCIGPVEPLPSADLVLCHLLLIRTDERRYLATANRVSL